MASNRGGHEEEPVTEEQMVNTLRKADRSSVAAAAKARGVSERALYNWRHRFGEMTTTRPTGTPPQKRSRHK